MTEQQYMQLMAQQRGGQQRQPSPEQQAIMMQQQQMQEGPGAAGGFMGGLLDSALIGLLPNSSYQNPNDPANVGASKMGGLIGMILPMLLAKYGAGKVLGSLASKEGMLANWMGKTAQGVERTTEQLGRADMLASVLGGGIGGGLAEGPMGGLLGAAGLGAYSKFAGAGKLMKDKETYAIGELFGGGKVKPPKTPQQKAQTANTVYLKGEDAAPIKEKLATVYAGDKPHLYSVVDDFKTGLDTKQFAITKIEGKTHYITPREVIKNAELNPDVQVTVNRVRRNPDGGKPTVLEEETKTWAQLEDDLMAPFNQGKKVEYKYTTKEKGKTVTKKKIFDPNSWQKRTSGSRIPVAKGGSPNHLTELENHLNWYHDMPSVPGLKVADAPIRYGDNVFIKPTAGSEAITTSKGQPPISNEKAASQAAASGVNIEFVE